MFESNEIFDLSSTLLLKSILQSVQTNIVIIISLEHG